MVHASVIGCGNMGGALIKGLAASGGHEVICVDVDPDALAAVEDFCAETTTDVDRASEADVVVLAVKPDLLLLDEPFASLDQDRAVELRMLIRNLLDRHPAMAMICVTHDAVDAEALANRIWYLEGKPAELKREEPVIAARQGNSPAHS
jgi:ABC-type uncharacterized transport system YnjBCD ATPase subunit